jgi:hypothetical protein
MDIEEGGMEMGMRDCLSLDTVFLIDYVNATGIGMSLTARNILGWREGIIATGGHAPLFSFVLTPCTQL